jgi:flagellar hook capping protein FlgD
MKLTTTSIPLLVLISSLTVLAEADAGRRSIVLGPIEDVQFGPLANAPNGHISFLKDPHGYRIWVPGRLKTVTPSQEGGFLFDVPGWSADEIARAQPLSVFVHESHDCDTTHKDFDRNYAAMNAVVPGAAPCTLLAFYDAEYHVDCPNGEPLLSSIGLATSTDGGVTWGKRGQVIQGLDEAENGFAFVTEKQQKELIHGRILDDGASGPSAVVREDGGTTCLYLYYADRTPITGGDDAVYLARALLASDGLPGSWQKWTGAGWGALGDQTAAAAVVTPPPGGAALQPHVSWNTTLHCWLMVFKTGTDFEVARSADGLHWDPAVSLLPFAATDRKTAFPSLICPGGGVSQVCNDGGDPNLPGSLRSGMASQQATGAVGWLYYASLPDTGREYVGHRAPFRIIGSDATVIQVTDALPIADADPGAPPHSPGVELSTAAPNPSSANALIRFAIPEASHVELSILDIQGLLVKKLVDADLPAGRHDARWDGTDRGGSRVASGVYLCHIVSNGEEQTKKLEMRY